MKDNIVDMVIALRDSFNNWFGTFSNALIGCLTFTNIVIVIYATYVLASLGPIIDTTKEGRVNNNYTRGLFAVLKAIGYFLGIYCFGLLVVFIFPGSDFVLSLKKIIKEHPDYPLLGLGILSSSGIIAYTCAIIFSYIIAIYKKITGRR